MGERLPNTRVLDALARAIEEAPGAAHVDRLADVIGELVSHDRVTVTRYSVTKQPEFVSHRNFSDELARRYLDIYFAYDPFFTYWRETARPGVVPLNRFQSQEIRRGRYVKEFLGQSAISDEVGVFLGDGGDWCLAVFLERATGRFTAEEISRLEARFPVLAALHALHVRIASTRGGADDRPSPPAATQARPRTPLSSDLWPALSSRERQVVAMILDGHPSSAIAERLGIALGTVKNHRRRIYEKLDITTERELFLQYFEHLPSAWA